MPKELQKSVKGYFSKIKIANKQIHFRFRSCKHTKTPSFDFDAKRTEDNDVTLSDIDKFLYENFRSLYQEEREERARRNKGKTMASLMLDSPRLLEPPPPPEDLCRSDRFFAANGSSNSLITDEACSYSASAATNSSSTAEEQEEFAASEDRKAPEDFIVIFTHSPSPYEDFRRSMQEMVEARVEHSGKVDWEFMEELLFCYLDLNNKKSYRYILHAFVDLTVVLRDNSTKIPASRRTWSGRGGRRLKGIM
ncbi:ovate family protein [Dorcoceras hygrometricum]|uniref:Transcription repressor n=1 Tax=Dorcoceras hygrometricum TaxID=472368 RepID=A0A2Z7A4V7_9LAMI|nr:ovate family protein [Dorcoceras hygrometricum]